MIFQVPKGIVAVKQLFTRDFRDFMKEVEILKRISSAKHADRHLIKLLATYECSGQFHMVFPCAEGDLKAYWKTVNPSPIKDELLTIWMVSQCQGLAQALYQIHHYGTESPSAFMKIDSKAARPAVKSKRTDDPANMRWFAGRHGDIKPQNILWFPEGKHGILKITDFGIAQFTAANQKVKEREENPAGSVTYRSPECEDPDGELTCMCDIWALGCVYLVFVAWFIGGYEQAKRFSADRLADGDSPYRDSTNSFYTIENGRARVKDSVVKVRHS